MIRTMGLSTPSSPPHGRPRRPRRARAQLSRPRRFRLTRSAPRAGGPIEIPAADRRCVRRGRHARHANVIASLPIRIRGAKGPGIIGVVKANAYGHGAARVALALEAAGAPLLACADIEEGVLLRRAGVRAPILVFGALSIGDVDGVFDYDLTPTVSTPQPSSPWSRAPARRAYRLACHLKIDTGMNRLGFRHDQLDRTMPPLLASEHLSVAAVYTHFATADDPESALFTEQRERF